MLGALFCAAAERGISQEQLRDEIAPGLIGRRLSAADERQIADVLRHITGPAVRSQRSEKFKYASSMQGLRQEIQDLAKLRWGEAWSGSLNNLCRKFGVDHYNFLDIRHAKEIKKWLNREGAKESQGEGVPF